MSGKKKVKSLMEDLADLGMISESAQYHWRRIPFGKTHGGEQLECAIRSDGAVQLAERRDPQFKPTPNQVGMSRAEAIELVKILNKEFALDLLADLD